MSELTIEALGLDRSTMSVSRIDVDFVIVTPSVDEIEPAQLNLMTGEVEDLFAPMGDGETSDFFIEYKDRRFEVAMRVDHSFVIKNSNDISDIIEMMKY